MQQKAKDIDNSLLVSVLATNWLLTLTTHAIHALRFDLVIIIIIVVVLQKVLAIVY